MSTIVDIDHMPQTPMLRASIRRQHSISSKTSSQIDVIESPRVDKVTDV